MTLCQINVDLLICETAFISVRESDQKVFFATRSTSSRQFLSSDLLLVKIKIDKVISLVDTICIGCVVFEVNLSVISF